MCFSSVMPLVDSSAFSSACNCIVYKMICHIPLCYVFYIVHRCFLLCFYYIYYIAQCAASH